MILFERFELSNGLKVLFHEDNSTPMVAVNVLYDVGSRDESPDKTGFAHLFEHLMFSGSKHIKSFDDVIQDAGGENNAFTNSDITNFYDLMPAENLETAFWLESDRMLSLRFNKRSLSVQQKVVVEEFKETCLNEPYGDVWHHLSAMVYTQHPYQWPTIGKVPQHVADATLENVKDFFFSWYRPNNAILVVAGNTTLSEVQRLADKWFGDIPNGAVPKRDLPKEPYKSAYQLKKIEANVPLDALYLAFLMPGRLDEAYYSIDLLSDILGNGPSSRLYRRLLKQQNIVSAIDCYISGTIDQGIVVIEARPSDGITLATVEAAIWKELALLHAESISERELTKLINKQESSLVFSETGVLNKAINLAFFELLGDAQLINNEIDFYRNITSADLQDAARQYLNVENCCALHYMAKKEMELAS